MRSFFCIELSEVLKAQLDEITQALKRKAHAHVSWVRKENLHITLKFLGEIEAAMVGELKKAAKAALDGIAPFELKLDRLGAFPDLRRPRVIWVGSTEIPEGALELHAALEKSLGRLGLETEKQKYVPHITLGRIKEISKGEIENLTRQLQHITFNYVAKAEGITLMESKLTPTGSIYMPVFQITLTRVNVKRSIWALSI